MPVWRALRREERRDNAVRDWLRIERRLRRGVYYPGFGVWSSQFENNYFTEMCRGSEACLYLRRIDPAP